MAEMAELAKKTRAWACYDCGKCTASCPIVRAGAAYSPRRHVLATNLGQRKELIENGSLFVCLTCGLCDGRCPAQVEYTQLVQKLRELCYRQGVEPECPHGGALQSVMRMMARGGTQQKRLEWLTPDLKTDPHKGEVFYWTGCTMYYDAFFGDKGALASASRSAAGGLPGASRSDAGALAGASRSDWGINTLGGTRAAIRLLNRLDIVPVVCPQERCCGHDLLWNGDRASFEQLARHNVQLVAESGATTLVVSCAECLRTWKLDYAPFFNGPPPRILHISELLVEKKANLKLKPNGPRRVTFQDPCRLGRHLGIYDPPRQALAAVPGLDLVEMRRSGPRALCCAGGTWSNCDRFAKQLQIERLREARGTGASTLVTACPKCQVHLRCAMKDPKCGGEIEMEMRDVAELVADALE